MKRRIDHPSIHQDTSLLLTRRTMKDTIVRLTWSNSNKKQKATSPLTRKTKGVRCGVTSERQEVFDEGEQDRIVYLSNIGGDNKQKISEQQEEEDHLQGEDHQDRDICERQNTLRTKKTNPKNKEILLVTRRRMITSPFLWRNKPPTQVSVVEEQAKARSADMTKGHHQDPK
eukprot:jgi/Psemu1/44240/gm1.44240_g